MKPNGALGYVESCCSPFLSVSGASARGESADYGGVEKVSSSDSVDPCLASDSGMHRDVGSKEA